MNTNLFTLICKGGWINNEMDKWLERGRITDRCVDRQQDKEKNLKVSICIQYLYPMLENGHDDSILSQNVSEPCSIII